MAIQQMLLVSFFAFWPMAQASQLQCLDTIVPVEVNTDALTLNISPFSNSYESASFTVKSFARNANPAALAGNTTRLTATYDIAVSYCEPLHQNKTEKILQILTSGLGFDKSYWAFGNATYNYVWAASSAGYATLSYDRLGVGQSVYPDPYIDVQTGVEIAILAQLTRLARDGRLSPRIPKPQKIVHVGHSYGSLVSNGLVATEPALSDGLILTGFTHNTTWLPLFEAATLFRLARENNPRRFGHLSSGYLTWGDKYNNQAGFFSGHFDPAVVEIAEATKAPIAVAELVSFFTVSPFAPDFRGPVFMIAGQYDLSSCGGECAGVIDGPYSVSPQIFPNASRFDTYIVPNSGHGWNLHPNAPIGYSAITSFLGKNGL